MGRDDGVDVPAGVGLGDNGAEAFVAAATIINKTAVETRQNMPAEFNGVGRAKIAGSRT